MLWAVDLLYEVNLNKAVIANILNIFVASSTASSNFSSGTSLLINSYEKLYGPFLEKVASLAILSIWFAVSDHVTLFRKTF